MNSAALKMNPEEGPVAVPTSRRPARGVDDVRVLRAYLSRGEQAERFQALHQPRAGWATWVLVETWGLIFGAWALCFYGSMLWAPLALIVIGSRQRALGNRLHDAAHGNMFEGRAVNERVGLLLCALPMFEDYAAYRLDHLRHHASLGNPGMDPDYLELPPPMPGQSAPPAWAVFAHFALAPRMWRDSLLSMLPKVGARQRWQMLGWWVGVLGLVGLGAGARGAAVFALLWLASRASVYHLIKIFAEISDHVGLVPGSTIGYTRNLPSTGLSFFMHPHHDNYHLTHHLFPRIPLATLPRVHALLMEVDLYTQAQHCDSYFLGEGSVVRSWTHPKPEPVSLRAVSP